MEEEREIGAEGEGEGEGKGNGRKEGDKSKRGDGDRGEMVKKEGQKELSQVRRGLVLCLSLILSHQTVAYGAHGVVELYFLQYLSSHLLYTHLPTPATPIHRTQCTPTHPPTTLIHTHTSKFHHSQNSQIIPSTHTQIHSHLSARHGSPIHRLFPRFSKMGTSLHCQPAACLNIHTLRCFLSNISSYF